MEDELRRLVDRALSLGASYAEARYQVDSERVIRVRNGSLERVSTDSTEGFSVRVLYNGAWGFASGPTPSVELVETAFKAARAASALVGRRVSLAPSELTSLRYEVVEGVRLSDVQAEEAVKYLMDLDKDINIDKRIGVRMLSMDMMETRKTIVNSEGALVESRVPRLIHKH